MRIAMFARSTVAHGAGGMEWVAWNLACEWIRLGHEVHLYTTPLPANAEIPLGSDVPQIVELEGREGRYSRKWFVATSKVDHSIYDVIVGVSSGAKWVARLRSRPPVVLQVHGTPSMGILAKLVSRSPRSMLSIVKNLITLVTETPSYRRYDAAVAIGPEVWRSLAHWPRWLLPRVVEMIPNGVAVRPSLENARATGGHVAVVGRLVHQKGIDRVIRASKRAGVPVVVVGDGPARSELEALSSSLGITSTVKFLGQQDQLSVRDVIRDANMVAVPSRGREGLPTVVLEALAEQTPVIVSREVSRSIASLALPGVRTCGTLPEWEVALESESTTECARAILPDRFRLDRVAEQYLRLFSALGES